jgi:hypothetical protein
MKDDIYVLRRFSVAKPEGRYFWRSRSSFEYNIKIDLNESGLDSSILGYISFLASSSKQGSV